MTNPTECPNCLADLQGPQIPDEIVGTWFDPPDGPVFYSRMIGVEIRGVYDGALYWMCPDCGWAWHRWENEAMRAKAAPFIKEVQDLFSTPVTQDQG